MLEVPTSFPTLLAAGLYLLLVTWVGLWSWRRTRSAGDFFVAGRRLGLWVAALAAMASSFSGFVFLGGPGLAYRIGVGSLFINLPVAFTAALMCWLVARPLRLLAEGREVYTIPDALASRFSGFTTAGLAALAILVGTLGYLGSQLLALGRLLDEILGLRNSLGDWGLAVAILIGLGVMLFYSIAGGMVAGVYSDVLQGILMMLTALAVFAWALHSGGGAEEILSSIAASDQFGPSFLEAFGRVPVLTAMGFFFVFGIGTLGQPHVLHKFLMLRDVSQLKWMPLILAGSQTLCLLIWLGVGLAVPALVAQGKIPPLLHPDQATPVFMVSQLPPILTGLMAAGLLSAIMSSADSFLNIGSAVLVRDLPRAFSKRVADQLKWGRWAVLGVALGAGLVAYLYDDLIALLGTVAFGTFAAALGPALAIGLNWSRVSPLAATASIAVGLALNLGLELAVRWSWWPALPLLPVPEGPLPSALALAASLTTLLILSWVRPSSSVD